MMRAFGILTAALLAATGCSTATTPEPSVSPTPSPAPAAISVQPVPQIVCAPLDDLAPATIEPQTLTITPTTVTVCLPTPAADGTTSITTQGTNPVGADLLTALALPSLPSSTTTPCPKKFEVRYPIYLEADGQTYLVSVPVDECGFTRTEVTDATTAIIAADDRATSPEPLPSSMTPIGLRGQEVLDGQCIPYEEITPTGEVAPIGGDLLGFIVCDAVIPGEVGGASYVTPGTLAFVPLMDALSLPDLTVDANTPCPEMFEIRRPIYAQTQNGTYLITTPVDGCGFTRPEVGAALTQIDTVPVDCCPNDPLAGACAPGVPMCPLDPTTPVTNPDTPISSNPTP